MPEGPKIKSSYEAIVGLWPRIHKSNGTYTYSLRVGGVLHLQKTTPNLMFRPWVFVPTLTPWFIAMW